MTCASRPGARRCRPTGCATGCLPVRDLCLVARDDLGHSRWRHPLLAGARRAARGAPARTGRGPPDAAGRGAGRALIREGLRPGRRRRWPRDLLVGDAPYYGRFGFSRKLGRCRDAAADEPRPGAWATATGRGDGPRHALGPLRDPEPIRRPDGAAVSGAFCLAPHRASSASRVVHSAAAWAAALR
jgi:hypothetical protein